MSRLNLKIEARAPGSRARAATFQTLHGPVQTPTFMAVGTQATVKNQPFEFLRTAGCTVLLANTFHLFLRPGAEVFKKFGGIHRFMNWDGPVLTDSGGFQIFSLPLSREMTEEGARFQSYVDGEWFLLSPEVSIEMQKAIGSDIMMVLDECVPSTVDRARAEAAMHLTHRWAERSLAARGDSPQSLFGIIQGACFEDLRKRSAEFLTQLPFDGYAVGGLAVGETKERREEIIEATARLMPKDLPRYLMGVGTPLDILESVHRGIDMFDCIIPSQIARRGAAYTSEGRLQMRRDVYKFAEEKLDPACPCSTCANYSRAYLHHLYKCSEGLGWTLLTHHNLTFYHRLMREMRAEILAGNFAQYYVGKKAELEQTDNVAIGPKPRRKKIIPRLGDFEIHTSPEGFSSIRQISSGEVMHSVSDPTEEARRLYVEQSRLRERLLIPTSDPLVIWDVGLGLATNAMAAVAAYERLAEENSSISLRPLHLVSFERDLHPLELAIKHSAYFPHLYHSAPHSVLTRGRWESDRLDIRWELLYGDFLTTLESAPPADLIFYDPFSLKTDGPLWTPEAFAKVFARCAARPTELYTYSASTAIRAALLAANFYVGAGFSTGPKSETTVAFIDPKSRELLGPPWLERWKKSDAKFPGHLVSEGDRSNFENRIINHPQFM